MSSLFAGPELPYSPVGDDHDDAQSVSSDIVHSEESPDSTATSATELDTSETVALDEKKTTEEESLPENPFDSPASRALFDAIDQFQSCGAGKFVDIPQVSMQV